MLFRSPQNPKTPYCLCGVNYIIIIIIIIVMEIFSTTMRRGSHPLSLASCRKPACAWLDLAGACRASSCFPLREEGRARSLALARALPVGWVSRASAASLSALRLAAASALALASTPARGVPVLGCPLPGSGAASWPSWPLVVGAHQDEGWVDCLQIGRAHV